MDWNQAKDMMLASAAAGAMYYARQLVVSIQELNVKVAIILEKLNGHEDRIKKLEEL